MIDESAYPEFVLERFKKRAKTPEELEEFLYQWDERCGIRHYDGGQAMKDAEIDALQDVLNRQKKKQ